MRAGEVERAAALLRAGGLVVFPTETVYGVGAHALDPRAAARIFEVKGRPRFDPLIVHLAGLEGLAQVVARVPEAALRLAERFWPGPLTLVLPKTDAVPDLVTAGHDTVAVRVPRHPVAQALLQAAGIPVAAPSANRFGGVSPTRAEHVTLAVDMILDGGPCAVGVESTIVSLAGERPVLLRPGGLALEAIEAVVGAVEVPPEDALRTPGPRPPDPALRPRHPPDPGRPPDPGAGARRPALPHPAGRAGGLGPRRGPLPPPATSRRRRPTCSRPSGAWTRRGSSTSSPPRCPSWAWGAPSWTASAERRPGGERVA